MLTNDSLQVNTCLFGSLLWRRVVVWVGCPAVVVLVRGRHCGRGHRGHRGGHRLRHRGVPLQVERLISSAWQIGGKERGRCGRGGWRQCAENVPVMTVLAGGAGGQFNAIVDSTVRLLFQGCVNLIRRKGFIIMQPSNPTLQSDSAERIEMHS